MEDAEESWVNRLNKLTSFPAAEALVPINPVRIPAYTAGTYFFDSKTLAERGLEKPMQNLGTCFDYLESSHNDTHYNTRFRTVGKDTAIVNMLCELKRVAGQFLAGGFANSMEESYVN